MEFVKGKKVRIKPEYTKIYKENHILTMEAMCDGFEVLDVTEAARASIASVPVWTR